GVAHPRQPRAGQFGSSAAELARLPESGGSGGHHQLSQRGRSPRESRLPGWRAGRMVRPRRARAGTCLVGRTHGQPTVRLGKVALGRAIRKIGTRDAGPTLSLSFGALAPRPRTGLGRDLRDLSLDSNLAFPLK